LSVRRLPREEWERRLRQYKCSPQDGLGPLNTAEWWRVEWLSYPFAVPVEPDGYIDELALQRLIAGLVQSAPWGTTFDTDPVLPFDDDDEPEPS
jgi:hypothetical protein